MFRSVADTKPAAQSMAGSSVVFSIRKNLAVATTPLDEVTDPEAVALENPTRVTVNLDQYGNVVYVTDLLEQFSFDRSLNTEAIDDITFNMAESVDALVASVLDSGDNNLVHAADDTISVVAQADLGAATVESTLKAADVRYITAKLRAASVKTVDGMNYVAFIHPNVAADFRSEAASVAGSWSAPHEYVDTANIYAGEIGTFNGVRFIETPRVPVAGDVYTTFFCGKEALAEAVADEFHVVLDGRIVDPLKRKMALGWKGTAGWSIFRPEALWTVKSISTIN